MEKNSRWFDDQTDLLVLSQVSRADSFIGKSATNLEADTLGRRGGGVEVRIIDLALGNQNPLVWPLRGQVWQDRPRLWAKIKKSELIN